jgi:hypothetical protein
MLENFDEFSISHSVNYGTIATVSTNKMSILRYDYNNVLIHMKCYMFRPSVSHHQSVHSSTKQYLYLNHHLPHAERSEVHQCMIYRAGYVQSTRRSLQVGVCSSQTTEMPTALPCALYLANNTLLICKRYFFFRRHNFIL